MVVPRPPAEFDEPPDAWKTYFLAPGCCSFLPHAFRHDPDLLDSGAFGRVDDVDDILVLQPLAPTMNIVLSLR